VFSFIVKYLHRYSYDFTNAKENKLTSTVSMLICQDR
jgi:hypothetical protein